jgi:periplasmic protein TonB
MNRIPRRHGDPSEEFISRERRRLGLFALALLAIEAGCTMTYPPPATVATARPVGPGGPAQPQVPAESVAFTIDGYKRDVAQHIYRRCPELLFDGPPPPTLRSVVVLALNIDDTGKPNAVGLLRSNGFTELERVAISSVRRASPLPPPPRLIARSGHVEFVETWLFRSDGKFQIRSLADVQQDASALP